MKKIYYKDADYMAILFKDELESRSYVEDGIVIREDKKGNILGIDILNYSKTLQESPYLSLKEASDFLQISESTLRRYIKQGKLKASQPNGREYRINKNELLKLVA